MAINTNPTFQAGQKLTATQLQALLALRDNGPQTERLGIDAMEAPVNQWAMPGKFGATVTRDPATGKTYITQPRNVSTWGGNDTADVWDEQGNYMGPTSGATDARSLARLAAMSYGAYTGASAMAGAEGAAGAGAGAGTGTGSELGSAMLSSADKAALYGAEGYGAGMTGAQTAAFEASLASGGGLGLADAAKTVGSEVLKNAIDNKDAVTNGFDTLGKVVTAGGGALLAGDALSNPVDTSRFNQLFDNLLAEQGKSSARSEDLWQSYLTAWKPVQDKFADATLNYDTAQRRETAADNAVSGVTTQFDRGRVDAGRQLTAAGVDPSTIAALDTASRIDQAKAEAGAANNARNEVEKTGLNLLAAGSNLGLNVVQGAGQQSQIATGTTQAANSVLNTQGGLQNVNTQNRNAIVGDLFSGAMSLYGMYSSSKKTKHRAGKLDGLAAAKAVERSPSERWRYKAGMGDGSSKARVGPMAEDLHRVAPGVSNGKQVDGIALAGLHHAAIGGLSKVTGGLDARLDRIERRLGLADAR